MSGENKNKGLFWLPMLRWVIAIVLDVSLFLAGSRLGKSLENLGIWTAVVLGVLLILLAVNFVADICFRKKLDKLNVKEVHEIAEARRQRMEQNLSGEKRRLWIAYRISVVYLVLVAVLSLMLAFLAGAWGGAGNILQVFSLYFIYGFVSRLVVKKEKRDYSGAIPEGDFPGLYKLAKEAAGEIGKGKKFHIFVTADVPHGECNAGVGIDSTDITLYLGAVLLCVLDREELYQVLLHEFAHLEHNDPQNEKQFVRLLGFLAGDDGGPLAYVTSLALRFPLSYLHYEGRYYFLLASRYKELDADAHAAHGGDALKQAGALAKISGHSLYIFEQEPYFNLYVAETVPEHFATDRAGAFRKALGERETDWRRILENEIPSRAATHPTFRQRWEALGCCEYSLIPSDLEDPFAQECFRAAQTADKFLAERTEEYSKGREENYEKFLQIVQQYESGDGDLPPEELKPVIHAYFALGMPEKMEALCDKILREHDSPYATVFARYFKGVLLLYRYDRAGLDMIYETMEINSNYVQEGLSYIGRFCTMMGLQEDLDIYRERALEFMQEELDHHAEGITSKADLSAEQLPEGWQEKILQYALDAAGTALWQVYLVHHKITEDYAQSAFVLRFGEGTSEDAMWEVYDKIFNLLDNWPVNWEFSLYMYEESMEKPLGRVKGSCIYTAEK